jgi:hypothetical protein
MRTTNMTLKYIVLYRRLFEGDFRVIDVLFWHFDATKHSCEAVKKVRTFLNPPLQKLLN